MIHICYILYTVHHFIFFRSSTVQFQVVCAYCSLRFLFLIDRSETSYGLLLFLPQALASCAFWDAFLLTVILKSDYLPSWRLPVSSNLGLHPKTRSFFMKNCSSRAVFCSCNPKNPKSVFLSERLPHRTLWYPRNHFVW